VVILNNLPQGIFNIIFRLEIRKKNLNLYEKNIRIEFFDTNVDFHQQKTSKGKFFKLNIVYYKLCNAFFYFIDLSETESLEFIKNLHSSNINNESKNCIYFAMCLNYEKNNTEIKQFCEDFQIVFFPINFETFSDDNEQLKMLFTWIVLKKLKKKKSQKQVDKPKSTDSCGHTKDYNLEQGGKHNQRRKITI
jgi:hypothetical protein